MSYLRRLACLALLLNLSYILLKIFQPSQTKDAVNTILDEVVTDLLSQVAPRGDPAKILSLQSELFCSIKEGKWTTGSDSWPRFSPRSTCSNSKTPIKFSSSASVDLCRLLSGKRILFVGPETTFHLHSLWLNSLELHENRSLACLGHEFCTFHHICRELSGNDFMVVEEVSGRKKKIPSKNTLLAMNSSLLQFSFSMTLNVSRKRHEAFIEYAMHEQSGIRVLNSYWLNRARKADIIIFNRGPVPAPAGTYTFQSNRYGNWTFALALCSEKNWLYPMACKSSLESSLINAALSVTMNDFLPNLLFSLKAITRDYEIPHTLLLWQGSWFIQPTCAIAEVPGFVPLLQDIWSTDGPGVLVDPWTFYYNVQVYMHERILRNILPNFNITYIPLSMPACVTKHARQWKMSENPMAKDTKDCLREPWPDFSSRSLEVTFFNALVHAIRSY